MSNNKIEVKFPVPFQFLASLKEINFLLISVKHIKIIIIITLKTLLTVESSISHLVLPLTAILVISMCAGLEVDVQAVSVLADNKTDTVIFLPSRSGLPPGARQIESDTNGKYSIIINTNVKYCSHHVFLRLTNIYFGAFKIYLFKVLQCHFGAYYAIHHTSM